MAIADEALLGSIQAALQADPRLDSRRHPVRLRLASGAVRLEGEVGSLSAKRLAGALAQRAAGGREVEDALTLAPAGEPRGDGAIRDTLVHALQQQRELHNCTVRQHDRGRTELLQEAHDDWPSGEIELRVEAGVVTLDGKVISLSHRRMLQALAWRTPAVRNVVDRLRVEPAEEDNDDELTDAVRLVLEMDPLVPADQLAVRSEDGVVTLSGALVDDEERQLAERDAWLVSGVRDVRNQIELRAS